MTLNETTIRQTFYKDLYDVLNGNIGSYNSSSQPTVSRAFITKSKVFPQIVLHPVLKDKTGFYIGDTTTDNDINVRIDIYTTGSKKKDVDVLNDDIEQLLGESLQGYSITGWSESMAQTTDNNNSVVMRSIAITFMYTN